MEGSSQGAVSAATGAVRDFLGRPPYMDEIHSFTPSKQRDSIFSHMKLGLFSGSIAGTGNQNYTLEMFNGSHFILLVPLSARDQRDADWKD